MDWDAFTKKVYSAIDGVSAVYTYPSEPPVNCTVCINYDVENYPQGFESTFTEKEITIEGLLSEIGEKPRIKAVFTIASLSKAFTVNTIESIDDCTFTVGVHEN